MAKLHRYNQSSDQSGYYLRGAIPDSGYTTIQVRPICEDLFNWLGFSIGDQVPHDLLTGLLDVGLLYTGEPTTPAEDIPDDFDFDSGVKNVLSQEQYDRLIGFVRSYGDDAPARVEDLIDRLDAQSSVVDDKYIPDTEGGITHTGSDNSTNSRRVDHGQFQNIVQKVYGDEDIDDTENSDQPGREVPPSLENVNLSGDNSTESILHAAIEYHNSRNPVVAANTTEESFKYASRLITPESATGTGPRCGFRVDFDDDKTVVLETICDIDSPNTVLEYGESGIWHRLVIATDEEISWETIVPQRSEKSVFTHRGQLLEHQITALRMMNATLEKHPGIEVNRIIQSVVGGGYLQRGIRTGKRVWETSGLLGELLKPTKLDYVGTVDFFNDTGGYGFIDTEGLEEDVFYHMEDVGGPDITEGQRVKFGIQQAPKGPRVTNLIRLNKTE